MSETITGEQALELLRRAVDEKGWDHIPPIPDVPNILDITSGAACFYREFEAYNEGVFRYPEGEPIPVCGVGHALHYAGILDRIGEEHNTLTIGGLALGGTLTTEAIEVFSAFQAAQDMGMMWGQALDSAEAAAVRIGITVGQV